ncbi:hypothetical protein JCM11491_003119 [Sporobolomyces phaffii]
MTSTAQPSTTTSDRDNWSTDVYSSNAAFVYSKPFTSPVVDLLAPRPGERILDLGCGHGSLTLESLLPAVLPSGGSVVGLDSSPDLLATAKRATLDARDSVEWIERDAHNLVDLTTDVPDETCDAVFSNAALHWMKRDPERVVRGVHRVLKPRGRFVGEMGGFLNVTGVRGALHSVLRARGYDPAAIDPWFFPTPDHYRALLEQVGFTVETCELVPRPTTLPTGLAGWLETFAFAFLAPVDGPAARAEVIADVCRLCEVDMRDPKSGEWSVMYVRLRFKASKE